MCMSEYINPYHKIVVMFENQVLYNIGVCFPRFGLSFISAWECFDAISYHVQRASLLDIQDDLFSVQQNLIKELSNLREV